MFNLMITFEYQGKIYKPSNLENKLKKLGVTLNDIKILEDTETKAEKERKERDNKSNDYDPELNVWWDNKSKGWFINRNGGIFENPNDINRYKFIGKTFESKLSDFIKEHFKEVIYKKD